MKTYKFGGVMGLAAVAGAALLCVFTLFSGISHSGVATSKHNLSLGSPGAKFDTAQVCVFCHTPHHANPDVKSTAYANADGYQLVGGLSILLWNRDLANIAATSYTTYTSSSFNPKGDLGQVRVYSLMCLSCHDGVSALNVLLNYPTDAFATPLQGEWGESPAGYDQVSDPYFANSINIGGRTLDTQPVDLSNDHPISFDYGADHPDVVSGGLEDPGSLGSLVKLFPNPSGATVSMECPSCHDVHNQGSVPAGTYPFLVMSNDNSQLCLTCHLK